MGRGPEASSRKNPPGSRRSLREAFYSVLILSVSVLITLLAFEAGLRLLKVQDVFNATVNTWDREVGRKQIPGAKGFLIKTPQYRTDLLINSKGLRDKEYSYAKPKGTRRILCLGDSFTCGYGVQSNETFPKLLESLLNAAYPDQTRWEVLNAGVGGTGTAHQLAWFESEGFKYDPDLVVLCFTPGNDFWDSIGSGLYSIEGNRLVKHDAPRTWADRVHRFTRLIPTFNTVLARSHLVNFVRFKLSAINFRQVRQVTEKKTGTPVLWPAEDALTFRLLAALRDASLRHNGRLVMVVVPPGDFSPQSGRTKRFMDYAQNQGVPCLDLAPMFGRNAGQTIFPDEGHWNQRGHQLVAQFLHDFLEKKYLLDNSIRRSAAEKK